MNTINKKLIFSFKKRNLTILLLLCFYLTANAQSEVSGIYKYVSEKNERLPYNFTLSLNCNNTFIIDDSTTNSIGKGTWKVKNDTTLELSISNIIVQKIEYSKKMTLTFFIRNNNLYEKIMTRNQYNKQMKKIDKKFHTCLGPVKTEDYEQYKIREENCYLIKSNYTECM